MLILSLDVETTGLNPEVSDLLSVGGVLFEASVSEYSPVLQFQYFLRHEQLIGHPRALAMNIELVKHCLDNDRYPGHEVGEMIYKLISPYGRVVFAGKNFNNFDRLFLEHHLPGWESIAALGRRRTLDPTSMFIRATDEIPPDLQACCKRAGVLYNPVLAHDALYDADCVARCIHQFLHR